MSKKAEKRKALKAEKQKLVIEKTVQQLVKPSPQKTPIIPSLETAKIIKQTPAPVAEHKMLMTYSRVHEDRDGAWSWGRARDWGETLWNDLLLPFLTDYCTKKWGTIDSESTNKRGGKRTQKHRFYRKGVVCKEARDRLIEIKKDDMEEHLFRFRLGGKERLYGFRKTGVFSLLWLDLDHKIYPSRRD